MATALKLMICSFLALRSSLLRPDRTFVRAWICTDDTRASRLQAKGRRCYLSQNIGPAVTGSAGPARRPCTHRHFITKLMLITARSFTTIQHLHSLKFTLVDKTVLSSLLCLVAVCCVGRHFLISNVARMRTRRLIPKLKTTVIDLGARLVHTSLVPRLSWNANIVSRQEPGIFLRKHDVIKIGPKQKGNVLRVVQLNWDTGKRRAEYRNNGIIFNYRK